MTAVLSEKSITPAQRGISRMNPIVTGLLLTVGLTMFIVSIRRRWKLLMVGTPAPRFDQPGRRFRRMVIAAFAQPRMMRYPLAGLAHKAIFFGFLVLLLRSLILFARGFVDDPDFGYWIFDRGDPLGNVYGLIKDGFLVAVVIGTLVFLYFRLIKKLSRLTLSGEGVLILAIILVMMIADVVYDSASFALANQEHSQIAASTAGFDLWEPLGSSIGSLCIEMSTGFLKTMMHLGFWTHIGLVLIFLNLLPHSKHFHIITALPNLFFQDLDPPGRLKPIEDIEGRIEREETLGVRSIDQLSWKGLLDLYTCTECGRCTEHCPASLTGKQLSPMQLTIDLRDHLYKNQSSLTGGQTDQPDSREELVPAVIDPEVLWACTTCGACEQECPLHISYVDKIVDLRRHLVMEKGECAASLQEAFSSMEATGSPYGITGDERLNWTHGIDVPLRSAVDDVEILFWVGCAPAADERAKQTARAVAKLLNLAGVKWAVLGPEEHCTGDAARRAGNEYLFQEMARKNIEILGGYGTKKILTACPHCYNTLKNEYPDFGGHYDVVHHSEFLARLITEGRLKPIHEVKTKTVYHDSCYLGRHNDIYDAPRAVLESIPGLELVEADASRDRGMCCGAGGAQMFKEDEPGDERVNTARTRQLLATGAETISSACPFCQRMLGDALSETNAPEVEQLDIAQLLLRSVEREPASPDDKA